MFKDIEVDLIQLGLHHVTEHTLPAVIKETILGRPKDDDREYFQPEFRLTWRVSIDNQTIQHQSHEVHSMPRYAENKIAQIYPGEYSNITT